MEWIETPDSSNIARFAHDPTTLILTVEFNNGGLYNYYDVPEFVFTEMRNAPSKGQFLAQRIKGVYRYARV